MNPLISVIVPVYNREKYIEKCIRSITEQSYRNLEIIIVNDGSTDGSLEIINSFADSDSRIRVIDKPNGGVSSARNAGLKEAKGEFIGFVDGDDYIEDDMYLTLINAVNEGVDIAACRFYYFKNGKEVNGTHFESNTGVYSSADILNCFYKTQNSEWVSMCNKVIRKSLFDGLSFPEGRVFEDWAMAPFIYYRAEKIFYTDEKKYYYVVHENESIFHNQSIKRHYDCVLNDYDHFLFFNEIPVTDYNSSIKFIIRSDFRKMCKVYKINKYDRKITINAFKLCLKLCSLKECRLELIFYILKPFIGYLNRRKNGKN